MKLPASGVEFVHRLREQPWRQRVMRFYDYDGHLIEAGERMEHVAWRLHGEGLSLEEIGRITYLDQEAVARAVQAYAG